MQRIAFTIPELHKFNECYPCARKVYSHFKQNNDFGIVTGISTRMMQQHFNTSAGVIKKGVHDLEKLGLITRPPRQRNNQTQTYTMPYVIQYFETMQEHLEKIV